MAVKPETRFTALVTKRLPSSIYKMKNNNSYTGGIPDLWLSGYRGDMWIEMKYLPRIPSRAVVDPKKLLSALQLQWLNNRHSEGRKVAVIIGCPTGGVVLQNRAWENEIPAANFVTLIKSPSDLALWITSQID
jgi:hypothetical protein